MRIVHYLDRIRLADGGVVRAVLDICTLLAQHGHEVVLVACDAPDVPAEWSASPDGSPMVEIIPEKTRFGGFFNRAALRQIKSIIAGADVLHLHTVWDRGNLQFAKLARRLGLPYVITAHGMLDDWSTAQRVFKKRIYHGLFLGKLMRHAAFVHCTAEFEKTQSQKWFPPQKGYVIPLIFDLASFAELPGPDAARHAFPALAGDGSSILFLSRVHPKKSVEVLIDAAATLRDDGLDIDVFIAGTGEGPYIAQLKEQVARLDLKERVHFLGLVVGEEKVSLFEACDVFALPTSQENFGFVLVESLAAMTPVVTTKGVDIWPELEASGGAIILERSAIAFAEAIRALLADADGRVAMGRAGREWVLEYLQPERIVGAFEKMYTSAAGKVR